MFCARRNNAHGSGRHFLSRNRERCATTTRNLFSRNGKRRATSTRNSFSRNGERWATTTGDHFPVAFSSSRSPLQLNPFEATIPLALAGEFPKEN